MSLRSLPSTGSKRTRYPDTRWKATFFSSTGQVVEAEAEAAHSRTARQSSDIIQGRVFKHIGNPVGTWNLSLVPRQDYLTMISPGDWCRIEGDNGDGNGFRLMMYGPVKAVRRQRRVGEKGVTSRMTSISGADFGQVIARTSAIYDAKLGNENVFTSLGLAAIGSRITTVPSSPAAIVRAILQHYMGAALPQLIDPLTNQPFGASINLDYLDDAGTFGQAPIESINPATSLWELMQQWSNLGVNELFADYRGPRTDPSDITTLVPSVILRQCPFWGEAWDNLPSVSVDSDECFEDDFGTSDDDVKNFIRPTDEAGVAAKLDHAGFINPESIRRFGFSRLENPTQYVLDPQNGSMPLPGLIEATAALQALWHHSNEKLLNGSCGMYFRPEIRVGYKMGYYERDVGSLHEYYIESVGHGFNYGSQSTTELTVTRGRDVEDALWHQPLSALVNRGILADMGNTVERSVAAAVQGLSR